jgi:hypothetical protein
MIIDQVLQQNLPAADFSARSASLNQQLRKEAPELNERRPRLKASCSNTVSIGFNVARGAGL